MVEDRIEDQLQQLLRAVRGEPENGYTGLVQRVTDLQRDLQAMANEQRQWRDDVDRRLTRLEQVKPITMSERSVYVSAAVVIAALSLLLVMLLIANGKLG